MEPTEYTKVIIECDVKGRMNISCLNDRGTGHGYRLAGPKFYGDDAKVISTAVLDDRAVREIREYLAIYDQIAAARDANPS